MIESAVILAAGMGTRMKGEAGDRPKGFLQFGEQPIIEESIQCLTGAGIRDIVIVTGHGSEFYDALAADRDGLVRTVHNAAFAESGSMYSLACAKDLVKGSFLLLESDLIYEPRALSELLAVPDEDAILLSGPTDAGDEVFVATLDGHLVDMSKDREALIGNRGARIAGELVGISRISQPLFEIMLRLAGKVFESSLMYDYETDCLVAAARERDIACPLVPDLAWAEIDDPDHLRRAREDVYPEIRRLTTKN